jgi:hypothetical protein
LVRDSYSTSAFRKVGDDSGSGVFVHRTLKPSLWMSATKTSRLAKGSKPGDGTFAGSSRLQHETNLVTDLVAVSADKTTGKRCS